MSHPFEAQLAHIRETLLRMSSLTEHILASSVQSLVGRDEKLAAAVEEADSEIDQLEVAIDELVINYMATHAPVATDCRFMLVASKISSNLERIGDQATTVGRRARALCGDAHFSEVGDGSELSPGPRDKFQLDAYTDFVVSDLAFMARRAQGMLRDSITAFIEARPEVAQDIIGRDKAVDEMNRQVVRGLTSAMLANPRLITVCLHLIVIAKSLERVADHAENIAEEVFYLYRGQDIRHEHGAAR